MVEDNTPQRIRICAGSELPDRGLGVRFEVEWDGRTQAAFVVRYRGHVHAYLNSCAHIPIELDYQPGDFFDLSQNYLVCATHGAYYAPQTGLCLGGPCPGRHLTKLNVVEEDEQVFYYPARKD
ncbi:Ferredoxin subunit of nitrite reductase or a ring-hydroxylating dioxygenase [Andreprevotia lacus DSM 23236]|jgi:nitrite reductase/ring-hydroxylating ferredoxin subunit|uniref:Ferredoxin subunit of nitrite reductase or a ring-hydroxylating dioxygenase n=1 Tax=Andreprevotia lacus DSM 23236 TaxID=1121001 RepID=A0A1W1X6K6_9NEIS|nr:Rieske 2Fe-2S domain-containing protein [Andreprevotia lacus]SMC19490.1 Ferredoxin subunit of nitrite reductase or a ring-hydroxylating dioxygenase [Andreprevotia lacus DSM 23236]